MKHTAKNDAYGGAGDIKQRVKPRGWRKWFRDAVALWMGLRDPTVPWYAKLTGLAAVIYILSPVDLIPDLIPIIGWLDDVAMLPLAGYIASRLIPVDTMASLRERADLTIMRWGPRAGYTALAVLFLWLALAALGGYFMWRNWAGSEQQASPVTPSSEVVR